MADMDDLLSRYIDMVKNPTNDSSAIFAIKNEPDNPADTCIAPSGSGDLIDRIISERQRLLRNTMADIISSIDERRRMLFNTVSVIEQRECDIKGMIMNLAPWVCRSIRVDYKRINLEREYTVLKKIKADHYARCFQDVAMLRKELRELWQEYLMMRQWDLAKLGENTSH